MAYNKKILSDIINKVTKAKGISKPKDIDYNSKMGYRDDSPFRNKSSIDINTPNGTIDMSNTGKPLLANGRYLPPYSGTHQFNTNVVTEQPLQAKRGGLVRMPKPTKKGLASKKYSRSLSATNRLFTENALFKKKKSKKRKVFDPNAKYYQGGGIPYSNLPATYQSALQNFVYPNAIDDPERTGYNSVNSTISYDSQSPIENMSNDWWREHELFHDLQNQAGGMSTSGVVGQRPNPYVASDDAMQGYYNRREADVNRIVDGMIAENPDLQFIPRDKLIEGSQPGFVGAEDLQYADPSTLEGEARQYEQYIKEGNPSIFPKQSNEGISKRIVKRYPGMQGVYGPQGENLNVIKDPNYAAADYGFGNIEFIFPGSGTVNYSDDYTYQSPTPDKYTAVYNPKGANKHDVFLDMMHGMRNDPEYMKLLDIFSAETRKARGESMDHWYRVDSEQDPYLVADGREKWDNNFIDGVLRSHLAKKGMGRHSSDVKGYKMERQDSTPEMYKATDDIYKYLKGKYEQGGYIETKLTPKEIEQYAKGGYIVEELDDYNEGGSAKCNPGEFWDGTKCVKIPEGTKYITDPIEYEYRKEAYADSLHKYNLSNKLARKDAKIYYQSKSWAFPANPVYGKDYRVPYSPTGYYAWGNTTNPIGVNNSVYKWRELVKATLKDKIKPVGYLYSDMAVPVYKKPVQPVATTRTVYIDCPPGSVSNDEKTEVITNDPDSPGNYLKTISYGCEREEIEKLPILKPNLIKQKLDLGSREDIIEEDLPPTYTPSGDDYIIKGSKQPLLAKRIQRKTNFNPDYYTDYLDEEGNYIEGEVTKAEKENRRIDFSGGATTKKDLKAQKEYNKAYDEYEKIIKQKELERKFIESQMGLSAYFKNGGDVSSEFIELELDNNQIDYYRRGGYIVEEVTDPSIATLNNYAPGGELSPKDLDPATLEKYLSDLRDLENSIKKGYKNNKWYPHSSIEGGANTIAYGHKLMPGESFASGLTEQQARDLQKKDVLAHQVKAEKYVDDKYGKGSYDKLPQNSQMLLTDYAYNLGSLNPFPSFVEGVVKGDKNKMLQEYERRGLPARNKWTQDVINTTDFSEDSDEGFDWFNPSSWFNKKNGGAIEIDIKNEKDLKEYINKGYIIEEL